MTSVSDRVVGLDPEIVSGLIGAGAGLFVAGVGWISAAVGAPNGPPS